MKEKKYKNIFLKKFILLVFVCLFLLSSPFTTPKAHALWPDIPGFTYKQMLEDIRDRIKGIIMGMLKQQAISAITKQMDSLISGNGSGSPRIITDWESYLYKTPDNNTKLYMNDYLSRITSGRGSLGSYRSEGFGGGSGYAGQLVAMAKVSTINRKDPSFSYEGNPANMFSGGNFKNFNSYLSGINNPWAFDINAQSEYAKKKAEERNLAAIKSQAYLGGIGIGEGANGKGKITLPGSAIVQQKANVMDLGNKVLASATHPEEVVTALVSKLLTQAMRQGISMVQSKVGNLGGLGSVIGGLNPSSFFDALSSSSSVLSSGSAKSSEAAPEIGGMGYVEPSNWGAATSEVGGMGYSGDSSSGSTSTAKRSSIPPPSREKW